MRLDIGVFLIIISPPVGNAHPSTIAITYKTLKQGDFSDVSLAIRIERIRRENAFVRCIDNFNFVNIILLLANYVDLT